MCTRRILRGIKCFLIIEMSFEKIKTELFDKLIDEISQEKYMDKMHTKVIDPLIRYTFDRLYPYLLATTIFFILIFIVAIMILCMVMRSNGYLCHTVCGHPGKA